MVKRHLSGDHTSTWTRKVMKFEEEEVFEDYYWELDGTMWVKWSGQWWLQQDNGWWSKYREPTESDTESSTDEEDLLDQAQEVVNHQMSSDLNSSLELEDDQSGSNPEQVPIDVQDIMDSMAMIGIN
jgi:hypothetical protein